MPLPALYSDLLDLTSYPFSPSLILLQPSAPFVLLEHPSTCLLSLLHWLFPLPGILLSQICIIHSLTSFSVSLKCHQRELSTSITKLKTASSSPVCPFTQLIYLFFATYLFIFCIHLACIYLLTAFSSSFRT